MRDGIFMIKKNTVHVAVDSIINVKHRFNVIRLFQGPWRSLRAIRSAANVKALETINLPGFWKQT